MIRLRDEDKQDIESRMIAAGYTNVVVSMAGPSQDDNMELIISGVYGGDTYENNMLLAADMDEAVFVQMIKLAKDACRVPV